jgi:hypothetical protein
MAHYVNRYTSVALGSESDGARFLPVGFDPTRSNGPDDEYP